MQNSWHQKMGSMGELRGILIKAKREGAGVA